MKKSIVIRIMIFALILFVLVGGYLIADNIYHSKAKAVISNDYSQIYYDNKVYVLYNQEGHLDYENPNDFYTVNYVVVEDQSFFWNIFLMNYIHVSKDEKIIFLSTDYDLLESNYYKLEE